MSSPSSVADWNVGHHYNPQHLSKLKENNNKCLSDARENRNIKINELMNRLELRIYKQVGQG